MNPLMKAYSRAYQAVFRVVLPRMPYREPELLSRMEELGDVLVKEQKHAVLIVTDKGIVSLGLMKELLEVLDAKKIRYVIYDEVVPNPTIDNVETARSLYLENNCDALIAFGGGSPIDCAKVTGARLAKPNQPVQKMRGLLKINKKIPFLAVVPTTAGTGSETTLAAVITDGATHHKYPISDFPLIPLYAVLDYKVTLGLPKHITSTTGLDALTHAVEAYIGRSTTPYTRQMAEEAVTLIRENLMTAYEDGSNAEARKNMLRAAFCAGVAFTRSYIGYVHGVAHSLGGQYGVPHGLANAVILPYFLKEYGETCEEPLARLARKCGITDKNTDDKTAAKAFIQWVEDMNHAMNIPETLDAIRPEDIPMMAERAHKESNPLYPVPKLMDARELEKIYHQVSCK